MDDVGTESERTNLEVQRLRKEIEKLALEVDSLKATSWWDRMIGRYLPVVTALLAVAGFWFGVIQYHSQQLAAIENRNEEFWREAARPFWNTQLDFYIRASTAASEIANSDMADPHGRAESEFWTLYWGPLASVEDVGLSKAATPQVEPAMVHFAHYLIENPTKRDKHTMHRLSLELAHAIRAEAVHSFELQPTDLKPRSGEK